MPIRQQRMLDIIAAAMAAQQSYHDLQATILGALEMRRQGLITEVELATAIHTSFYSCALSPKHMVLLAREDQHFRDCAARNDYAANRRAHLRAGTAMPKQQHTRLRVRKNRPGTLKEMPEFTPEAIARVQASALPDGINPIEAMAMEEPTQEQFAADDAMFASLDEDEGLQEELEKHKAALRRGDQ